MASTQSYGSDSSSDEEMIQPMKLSQYTNAILNGERDGSSPLSSYQRRPALAFRSKRTSPSTRYRPSVAFRTPSPSQTQDTTLEAGPAPKHIIRLGSPCPSDSKYAVSYGSSPSSASQLGDGGAIREAKTAEIRASDYIISKLGESRSQSAPASMTGSSNLSLRGDPEPVQDTITTVSSIAPSHAQQLYETVVNGSHYESAAACRIIAEKSEASHRRRRRLARKTLISSGTTAPARRGLRAEVDIPDDLPESETEVLVPSNLQELSELEQPQKLQIFEDDAPQPLTDTRQDWLTQSAQATPFSSSKVSLASSSLASHTFKRPDLSPLIEISDSPPPARTPLARKSSNAENLLHSSSRLPSLDSKTLTPLKPSPIKAAPMRPPPPPAPAPSRPPHHPATITATTTASTAKPSTSSSKRRGLMTLNSQTYQRLDLLGRGGSARVWRVMNPSTHQTFALKRVTLTDCSERALAGFRQEIDLLQKLAAEERVVRLVDWEIAPERGWLGVLMELGECDFNVLLARKQQAGNPNPNPSSSTSTSTALPAAEAKSHPPPLDVNFVRYYWKELLECVATVQRHGIVHSDLKPANFLAVRGRLKIIDFGIANEIGDATVNVHRTNHVGTPNYMSPESLIDLNEADLDDGDAGAGDGASVPQQRLMKLGKPSDVWSLACILYQMVYGRAPFAHIQGQMQKMRAITTDSFRIAFPQTISAGGGGGGGGGDGNEEVPVPPGLLATLKSCLRRDPSLRPTVAQLLHHRDPFLYPAGAGSTETGALGRKAGRPTGARTPGTVEVSAEGLASVLQSAFRYCAQNGVPREADVPVLARAVYEKLRRSAGAGGAGG